MIRKCLAVFIVRIENDDLRMPLLVSRLAFSIENCMKKCGDRSGLPGSGRSKYCRVLAKKFIHFGVTRRSARTDMITEANHRPGPFAADRSELGARRQIDVLLRQGKGGSSHKCVP